MIFSVFASLFCLGLSDDDQNDLLMCSVLFMETTFTVLFVDAENVLKNISAVQMEYEINVVRKLCKYEVCVPIADM